LCTTCNFINDASIPITEAENSVEINTEDSQDVNSDTEQTDNSSPEHSTTHEETLNTTQQQSVGESSLNTNTGNAIHTRSKSGIHKPKLPYIGLTETYIDTMEPANAKEALTRPLWKEAMQKEFQALMSNKTWILVSYQDQENIVDSKWVFKTKYKPDGSIERRKARLVAKGFQQTAGIDYEETFSPVIKASTVRIILSIAVHLNWEVRQLDINNAFLNGHLRETIFMHQPEGFVDPTKPNHICQLSKAIYGLKQAPRAWFDSLKTALLNWGF
jgi:histone deacetylase 1/2